MLTCPILDDSDDDDDEEEESKELEAPTDSTKYTCEWKTNLSCADFIRKQQVDGSFVLNENEIPKHGLSDSQKSRSKFLSQL